MPDVVDVVMPGALGCVRCERLPIGPAWTASVAHHALVTVSVEGEGDGALPAGRVVGRRVTRAVRALGDECWTQEAANHVRPHSKPLVLIAVPPCTPAAPAAQNPCAH